MLLADLGADVVKVEKKDGGDDARNLGERIAGQSLYSLAFNRNKRSIALDFRTEEAKKTIRDLAAKADVLIENFRPGTLEEMGCGIAVLHNLNPQLIIAQISGFGQTGPWSRRPCFDAIAQALGGLMSITGEPDGKPIPCGTFVVDYGASLYATIAILAALEVRRKIGRGQAIDVSLLETAASFLMTGIPAQIRLGKTITRHGSQDRFAAPGNTYRTKDGDWILIIAANQSLFARLTAAMKRPDLVSDPRFVDNGARLKHIDEIQAVVSDWIKGMTTEMTLEILTTHGIPAAKVSSVADVVTNPQLQARNFFLTCQRDDIGEVPLAALPFQFDGFRPSTGRPPPKLGEHGAEISRDWLLLD